MAHLLGNVVISLAGLGVCLALVLGRGTSTALLCRSRSPGPTLYFRPSTHAISLKQVYEFRLKLYKTYLQTLAARANSGHLTTLVYSLSSKLPSSNAPSCVTVSVSWRHPIKLLGQKREKLCVFPLHPCRLFHQPDGGHLTSLARQQWLSF